MRQMTDSRRLGPVDGVPSVNREIQQRVSGLIELGVSLLNILLILRFFLDLWDASPSHPFAGLIYSTSEPFLSAFQGLVRSPLFREVTPELNTLMAVTAYSLLGWTAIKLVRLLFAGQR
ncbi:MAG: hypothetical protein C3F07_06250 [Anaerolineales bacterium]|nr:YggT family protein [Anaerolineae bacterium]PWB75040.1 MAG: hypothetical protein C3F07_06250 [Anaerolineales bacterium]